MKISKQGLDLIKEVEGKRNTAYNDSGGASTIGIGHLLTKSERVSGKIVIKYGNPHTNETISYANGISDKHVYALFQYDLIPVESIISLGVKVPLTQYQYDALCSFIFNIGINAFASSTLVKVLNSGDYDGVPKQMRRWVYDNGKVIDGLKNRREKEIIMWKGQWNGK